MDRLFVTYLLIGAIVAVMTAILNDASARSEGVDATEGESTSVTVYLFIAAMWPVSVAVTLYSFISLLLARHTH